MKTSPASWRAFVASIIHACHLSIRELAELTDRQLVEIYAHERDKDGNIKIPDDEKAVKATEAPPSLERDLRDLMILANAFQMPPDKYEVAVAKLKAKWAAKATSKEEASHA